MGPLLRLCCIAIVEDFRKQVAILRDSQGIAKIGVNVIDINMNSLRLLRLLTILAMVASLACDENLFLFKIDLRAVHDHLEVLWHNIVS